MNVSKDSIFVTEMQTIDTCQAMFLPVGASASLLIMFLFFDSLQMIFAIFTASEYGVIELWPFKLDSCGGVLCWAKDES